MTTVTLDGEGKRRKKAVRVSPVYNIQNLRALNPSIDKYLYHHELMGYDINSPEFQEYMGKGLFKKLFKRIRKRIRKARKRRKKGKDKYRLDTPEGGLEYSKRGGLQFLSPKQKKELGLTTGNVITQGIDIPGIGNVPTVALLGIPLVAYLILQAKKKKAAVPAVPVIK